MVSLTSDLLPGLRECGGRGPHFIGHMIEKSKMYGGNIKSKRKTLVLAFLVPKPLGSIRPTSILFFFLFFQLSAGPPAHVLTLLLISTFRSDTNSFRSAWCHLKMVQRFLYLPEAAGPTQRRTRQQECGNSHKPLSWITCM